MLIKKEFNNLMHLVKMDCYE